MELLCCNVRISHLWMGLMIMKWGGRVMKLRCAYHLFSIILYFIYWHATVMCVLCTAAFRCWVLHHLPCLQNLPFLYSLHFLCSYWGLSKSIGFPCCMHGLCIYIYFIYFKVFYSPVSSPVADKSTATNKWKWQWQEWVSKKEIKWNRNSYYKCKGKNSAEYGKVCIYE